MLGPDVHLCLLLVQAVCITCSPLTFMLCFLSTPATCCSPTLLLLVLHCLQAVRAAVLNLVVELVVSSSTFIPNCMQVGPAALRRA